MPDAPFVIFSTPSPSPSAPGGAFTPPSPSPSAPSATFTPPVLAPSAAGAVYATPTPSPSAPVGIYAPEIAGVIKMVVTYAGGTSDYLQGPDFKGRPTWVHSSGFAYFRWDQPVIPGPTFWVGVAISGGFPAFTSPFQTPTEFRENDYANPSLVPSWATTLGGVFDMTVIEAGAIASPVAPFVPPSPEPSSPGEIYSPSLIVPGAPGTVFAPPTGGEVPRPPVIFRPAGVPVTALTNSDDTPLLNTDDTYLENTDA